MTRILMMNISDVTEEDYHRLYLQSDPHRRKKADRYLRQEDRVRCICAGRLLRYAVGTSDFEVVINAFGKPMVKDRPDFHYNLSHSGHWVVIAHGDCPVGIDVEKMDWNSSKEKLAQRFFTYDEQEYVFAADSQGIPERFFEIWTSKEGYLKYLGTGLQKALDSFSVLQLEFPNRFVFSPEAGYCLSLWTEDGTYELKTLTVSELLTVPK